MNERSMNGPEKQLLSSCKKNNKWSGMDAGIWGLKQRSLIFCVLFFFLAACNSHYTPKPKGYFKIDFPAHEYREFSRPGFPYQFEYPVYGVISRDSSSNDTSPDDPYWINLDFPNFNARLYLSYKTIGGVSIFKVKTGQGYKDSTAINTFENLKNEAYVMANKHTIKASSIEDSAFVTPNGVAGIFFYIGGNAATSSQFFVTDSTKHFFRGSLYFNAVPNEDSLKPVNQFLEEDIRRMVNTLRLK